MRGRTSEPLENTSEDTLKILKSYITKSMITTILTLIIITLTVTLVVFFKLIVNAYYHMLEYARQIEILQKENLKAKVERCSLIEANETKTYHINRLAGRNESLRNENRHLFETLKASQTAHHNQIQENVRLRQLVTKVNPPIAIHRDTFVNAFPEDKTIKLFYR